MAVIGQAVFVRDHTHDFITAHLGLERTADATIAAGRDDGAIRAAVFEQRFLHQRVGRAGLHAGAAGDAFGVAVMLVLAGGHLRAEAAAFNRQGEGALYVVAGADTARTDDAARRVESEIRISLVDWRVEMIAGAWIANMLKANGGGHFMQFAFAAGLALEGIERMVRHVKFHYIAPELAQPLALGMD